MKFSKMTKQPIRRPNDTAQITLLWFRTWLRLSITNDLVIQFFLKLGDPRPQS